ncbi:hypothetical protein LINPERHAP2_LOCUS27561, partial [Linum perenne]
DTTGTSSALFAASADQEVEYPPSKPNFTGM